MALFIKDGWITVYEASGDDLANNTLFFACLIDREYLEKFMENRSGGIEPGSEGKPSVFGGVGDDNHSE